MMAGKAGRIKRRGAFKVPPSRSPLLANRPSRQEIPRSRQRLRSFTGSGHAKQAAQQKMQLPKSSCRESSWETGSMTVKRRTFVVGIGLGLTPDEIKIEHELAVVHLGDPPFFMTLAPPGDQREPVINLSDGAFLTDMVWLTPKRAQGRVLFSLIEGAAEAVEYHLDMVDSMMEELEEEVAAAEAELKEAEGEEADAEENDPVDDFIERVNNGEITELAILDFETLEDFKAILGEALDEGDFQDHRAVMDDIVEEARVRGVPVIRVTGHADEFRDWLSLQDSLGSDLETTKAFAEYLRDRKQRAEGF
jgi:hypothetical protein